MMTILWFAGFVATVVYVIRTQPCWLPEKDDPRREMAEKNKITYAFVLLTMYSLFALGWFIFMPLRLASFFLSKNETN